MSREPRMPDLSRYDPAELNEAAAKVTSERGWLPLSERYRLAAALIDERSTRRRWWKPILLSVVTYIVGINALALTGNPLNFAGVMLLGPISGTIAWISQRYGRRAP